MSRLLLLLLLRTACAEWLYRDRYACGVCQDVLALSNPSTCDKYKACHIVNATTLDCESHCGAQPVSSEPDPSTFDLRISKGFGTKPYGNLRVSVITRSNQKPAFNASEFDYNAPFMHRWTGNTLSTKMINAPAGSSTIKIGDRSVQLQLPAQGTGVAGILIADPCVLLSSVTSLIACRYAGAFDTATRIPALLNAVAEDPSTDFWGVLGDNWYDRDGGTTAHVYDKLSVGTKSKIMLTVAGNHDYWVLGAPAVKGHKDQYGNGHMQWYAQDSKAGEHVAPGDGTAPFNFSVDPSTEQIAAISNSFYYNLIGNIGVIGYSGAYSLDETKPLMQEACAWLGEQHSNGGLEVGLLVGHWDKPQSGCDSQMAGPAFYQEMSQLPGCDLLAQKQRLKFFMGHTHCNIPHPHGEVGAGFMVAGQGMEGCGNFGIPILDTTESRVRVWYFDVASHKPKYDNYDAIMGCFNKSGWRNCTRYAKLWLDQELV